MKATAGKIIGFKIKLLGFKLLGFLSFLDLLVFF